MDSGMITRQELKNKYVFWDIDGTLAAYRFNNHIADPNGTDNGMSLEEIEQGIFLQRKPSLLMQKVLSESDAKKNVIMGHCQNQKEINDKQIWLDKYFPMIKERLLVFEDNSKASCIIEYCKKETIDLKEVIYVDDVIKFLREAERKGIESWHISSFLDWQFHNK